MLVVMTSHAVRAADPVEAAAAGAAADYTERLKTATNDLLAARERIAAARTPLAEATRSAENRIAALEGELLQLETTHGKSAETREQLRRENDEVLTVVLSERRVSAGGNSGARPGGFRGGSGPLARRLGCGTERRTGGPRRRISS